ncbi:tyrosine recombinase XerC [soil metagenome]
MVGQETPEARMEKAEAGQKALYLGEAVSFFLNSKRASGRSEKTLLDYRRKLEAFQKWIASGYPTAHDVPLAEVDVDRLEAYLIHLKERGLADSSRKSHLFVLRSFFGSVSRRLGVPDPCAKLDEVRFHSPTPHRTFLSRREADLLLSSMDKEDPLGARDQAMFSVMIYAGLRIEEVTLLDIPDVVFEKGREEVRVRHGKGNRERRIPMGAKLRRIVRRHLRLRRRDAAGRRLPFDERGPLFTNRDGGRLTTNTVWRTLHEYVRKSGLGKADITPHDLRRTFGTWFLQANPDKPRELAYLMGHSDLSQVMKYALSDEERARAGVAKL